MGKDIKEKYERACAIKDKALSLAETQLNGDISQVDAKELGEVIDIAKDMAELIKYCEEACYYHKVTEAMDEGSEEEKKYYLNKYIPEYEGKFYTPIDYARQRDSRGRYMYTPEPMIMDERFDPSWDRSRMYYTEPSGIYYPSYTGNGNSSSNYARDMREGRSGISRRTYMDMKESGADKESQSKELDHFMKDLADDMTEMIHEMSNEDKEMVKRKLAELASKIK